MNLPVIILGGGGHAKVLIEALLLQRREILGYTDPDETRNMVLGLSRLGDDQAILKYDPEKLKLVNGVGSIASTSSRKGLYDRFRKKGYRFQNVAHPSAIISSDVRLEEGVQIMAGAVVQPGSRLGANTIINTQAVVDHDCDIGAHVHVAPGAVVSGNVRIGEGVHVGVGAIIIQGVAIGERSIIGAGTVVLKDVPSCVTVVGAPGRVIRSHVNE
jgi:sugar O-acyltransferase (sialic acid O-acetyltransferase NeuD family)